MPDARRRSRDRFRARPDLKAVYELPYRGFGRPGRFPHVTQANEFDANVWADEKQNPYTYDPNDPYYWVRIRLIGGKTLMWGRASWRHERLRIQVQRSRRLRRELAHRATRISRLITTAWSRCFASPAAAKAFRRFPTACFMEDNSPRQRERASVSSRRRSDGMSRRRNQREATGSSGQFRESAVARRALRLGNLHHVPNAVVREITADRRTGLANGANFVDRRTGREFHAKARVVVVGASCLESTRLLLNSDLANSSGVLGHYLFDQFYVKDMVRCIVPEARGGRRLAD